MAGGVGNCEITQFCAVPTFDQTIEKSLLRFDHGITNFKMNQSLITLSKACSMQGRVERIRRVQAGTRKKKKQKKERKKKKKKKKKKQK